MSRPHKCRRISCQTEATVFKPAGVPGTDIDEIKLRLDEMEALRLGDLEGLYHDEAARRMGISRPTFGRIVESARHKVADALINGKMIVFEGGVVMVRDPRVFECADCGHRFEAARGTGRPEKCPACESVNFHRVHEDVGEDRGGQGRCRRSRQRVGQQEGDVQGRGDGRGEGRGRGRGQGGGRRQGRGGRGAQNSGSTEAVTESEETSE